IISRYRGCSICGSEIDGYGLRAGCSQRDGEGRVDRAGVSFGHGHIVDNHFRFAVAKRRRAVAWVRLRPKEIARIVICVEATAGLPEISGRVTAAGECRRTAAFVAMVCGGI